MRHVLFTLRRVVPIFNTATGITNLVRVNASINECLSRTILTSFTTFIVVLSIYLIGGGIIRDFSFALLIGVVVGTYSSIFVASPVLLILDKYMGKTAKR